MQNSWDIKKYSSLSKSIPIPTCNLAGTYGTYVLFMVHVPDCQQFPKGGHISYSSDTLLQREEENALKLVPSEWAQAKKNASIQDALGMSKLNTCQSVNYRLQYLCDGVFWGSSFVQVTNVTRDFVTDTDRAYWVTWTLKYNQRKDAWLLNQYKVIQRNWRTFTYLLLLAFWRWPKRS